MHKLGKGVSREKAGEILRHGEVHGKPLTSKQRGYFGLIRGGGKPTRLHSAMRSLAEKRRGY